MHAPRQSTRTYQYQPALPPSPSLSWSLSTSTSIEADTDAADLGVHDTPRPLLLLLLHPPKARTAPSSRNLPIWVRGSHTSKSTVRPNLDPTSKSHPKSKSNNPSTSTSGCSSGRCRCLGTILAPPGDIGGDRRKEGADTVAVAVDVVGGRGASASVDAGEDGER